MIYLLVRGRLGNQLFQYSATKSIQKKFYPEEEIALVLTDLKKLGTEEEGFKNALIDYKIDDLKISEKININIWQKVLLFFVRCMRYGFFTFFFPQNVEKRAYCFEKKIQPFLNYFGVYFMIQGYVELKPSRFKNKIVIGNFESAKYFNNIRDELLIEFQPKKKRLQENEELYKVIEESQSVCITIRRGDFVENPEFKKIHYICTPDYFDRAIEIVQQKVMNPTFIVFSDDIEWVKKSMNFPGKVYYESGTDPVWEKLRMMSRCKHFIISNSTFSWWAQYLAENTDKVVIAPEIWKKVTYKNGKIDIYEKNWITINV